ncbi:hypothetical protein F2Q69_00041659 [Brassica cretica]|uniref:Uncharacterized protein n=1 Tax=Brassica cretica TaxID=69181 RepID=A0A8S9NN34_BRACR|nr:hypothetical protein F2Q69_00041659 [Brassica cretica]
MSPQPQNLEPTSSIVQLTPPIFSIVQSLDSLVKDTHLGPGCCKIFGLMSTRRDISALSEVLPHFVSIGETDPQDVYTVFPDHTYGCAIGAKYEWEANSVALFWTLKASLSMSSGGLFKIRFLLRDILLTRS